MTNQIEDSVDLNDQTKPDLDNTEKSKNGIYENQNENIKRLNFRIDMGRKEYKIELVDFPGDWLNLGYGDQLHGKNSSLRNDIKNTFEQSNAILLLFEPSQFAFNIVREQLMQAENSFPKVDCDEDSLKRMRLQMSGSAIEDEQMTIESPHLRKKLEIIKSQYNKLNLTKEELDAMIVYLLWENHILKWLDNATTIDWDPIIYSSNNIDDHGSQDFIQTKYEWGVFYNLFQTINDGNADSALVIEHLMKIMKVRSIAPLIAATSRIIRLMQDSCHGLPISIIVLKSDQLPGFSHFSSSVELIPDNLDYLKFSHGEEDLRKLITQIIKQYQDNEKWQNVLHDFFQYMHPLMRQIKDVAFDFQFFFTSSKTDKIQEAKYNSKNTIFWSIRQAQIVQKLERIDRIHQRSLALGIFCLVITMLVYLSSFIPLLFI